MQTINIQGNQITLRDWRLANLDAYRGWLQPGREWLKLDAPYEPDFTQAQIERSIARYTKSIEANEWPSPRKRLVIADSQTERLLGTVNWYWQSEITNWLSVGVAIYNPANWRRGIGYEALGLWSEYLWQALPKIARLGLSTWSGNQGMIRLAMKLGFKEEARYRKARIVDGEYFDSVGYGVLREEWYQRYPRGFGAQSQRASHEPVAHHKNEEINNA